ncbi:MAG TPA: hypothetical protein VNZ22_12400 [Bacillota bacterium]|nr:hypothetical protein [Bacillota bacterium]
MTTVLSPSAYRPKSLRTSLWLAGGVALLAVWSACASSAPLWLSVQQACGLSPLMVKASEVGLAETDAPGDCLIPAVTATPGKPAPDSWAEFTVEVPQSGTYYLWARLRCPNGRPESFLVIPAGLNSGQSAPLVLGGNGQDVRQWHWDSQGAGSRPGTGRLKLELNAGKWTFRVVPYQASTTAYGPGQWREADLSASPHLNLLCLTDDPGFVPTDAAARQALGLPVQAPVEPRVTQKPLPRLRGDQPLAGDHKPLAEWMRVPRWFTKDSWREEVPTRHAGDTARLVREVAANGGAALRLSCFWGGEAYFQSQVAPHAPGLGELDYLREALEEGARTGVKVIAYMNPNALYTDHPLLNECAVRGPDGQVSPQSTYGGGPFANTRYACINHPRYRQFLRDVLTELFTRYQPAGLYVDGLTPHVCFCSHCQAKWRELFHQDMPVTKLSHLSAGWAVWAEMGRDPQPVGDVEKDPDAQRLTELMLKSLVEMTHELSRTVKQLNPEALTAFHTHPKPGTEADYDATLTEVYLTRPWTHTAWRSGELAGYSAVYRVPVLFNIYPHANCTAAEARYYALQGLAGQIFNRR